jgi:hypothetical protein
VRKSRPFPDGVANGSKKARDLVETGFDQTFSGPVRALPSLIWSPSSLSLKRMHFAANNQTSIFAYVLDLNGRESCAESEDIFTDVKLWA